MTTLAVCRVCLARNKKMHLIANTPIQTIFEKLSDLMLITKDRKPVSVCYYCFALLRKCWHFKEMSRKTDTLLKEILHNGIRFNSEKNLSLYGESAHILSVSPTKCVSMPDYIKKENTDVFIKEENIGVRERISVEIQTEGDPVAVIPVEYDVRMKTNLLKQELNSSEFDGDSINISCLSTLSQIKKPRKSLKEHNGRQITKTRRKDITAKESLIMGTTRKKSYACGICSKLFKQNNNLKKHMKTHTDARPFTCNKCIECFSNKSDLQEHILLLHMGQKLHVCDMCDKAFLSKYSLTIHITQNHLKTHATHRTATHNCDRCNKSFNHKGTLRLHMRIHTGDKPYACDKCCKRFSQKGTLQRHIRMHTGDKPYACDKCTKTFNQESSLKRHIKIHTGEKPYACTRCGKAYYESSHLTRHIRTHTGEKPYACDRCFQTFAQSSNLQAHMKKHTGEKATNYVCYECNKSFDHKSIFKRHLLKHTREKPYPCDRCDKKYADKRTLQRHIVSHNLNG